MSIGVRATTTARIATMHAESALSSIPMITVAGTVKPFAAVTRPEGILTAGWS